MANGQAFLSAFMAFVHPVVGIDVGPVRVKHGLSRLCAVGWPRATNASAAWLVLFGPVVHGLIRPGRSGRGRVEASGPGSRAGNGRDQSGLCVPAGFCRQRTSNRIGQG